MGGVATLRVLKPPPFEYRLPDSLEEALSIMAEYGDEARPLAGGQSLVPMMAFRLARPAVLVDLNQLDELASIDLDDHQVNVGAMVREKAAERSDTLARQVPLLARALPFIGHEAIRTRGTIGGASPTPIRPPSCPPSRWRRRPRWSRPARSGAGGRCRPRTSSSPTSPPPSIPTSSSPRSSSPPRRKEQASAFQEVARRHGDFAMVGVAAMLHVADGIIDRARIVLTGMADKPVRARGRRSGARR